jgi:hypothetical protein
LANECYDRLKKNSSSLSKNANIFAKIFGENIYKFLTSIPTIFKARLDNGWAQQQEAERWRREAR